jgi:polyketide cyclase/dehydrase/lipid transport protein
VAEYRFLTSWLLDASRERVWEVIHDQKQWPSWWRGVEEVVELDPGDELGVGSLARMTWRSFLPYNLEFQTHTTRIERPHLMEGEVDGELAGIGRWRLYEDDSATAVLYEWNVRTTRAWMNLLAPFARPIFAWNHNWVMARGGEGLAQRLGCRLLASG